MNKQFGISVYPDLQTVEQIKEYIELASKYNASTVFSSFWTVKGDKEAVCDYFQEFIEIAHDNQMIVNLDVNPDSFKLMEASYDNLEAFHLLDVDTLRMDISYPMDKMAALINNPYGIKIVLNASVIPLAYVQQLIDLGVDPGKIWMSHNFYPQRYTGMKWQKFLNINHQLKSLGVNVSAFISSQNKNTCGVWDATNGLCTVEKLRFLPMDQQVRIMSASGDVDEIIVGNAPASEAEFRRSMASFSEIEPDESMPGVAVMMHFGASKDNFYPQKKLMISLDEKTTEAEKDILFNFFPHSDVGDSSEWIWRSRMARFLNPDIEIRPFDKDEFSVGDVVIVNNKYPHYAGEIQIVLQPIINDGTRNYLGHLADNEQQVLELIKEHDVVVFMKED